MTPEERLSDQLACASIPPDLQHLSLTSEEAEARGMTEHAGPLNMNKPEQVIMLRRFLQDFVHNPHRKFALVMTKFPLAERGNMYRLVIWADGQVDYRDTHTQAQVAKEEIRNLRRIF